MFAEQRSVEATLNVLSREQLERAVMKKVEARYAELYEIAKAQIQESADLKQLLQSCSERQKRPQVSILGYQHGYFTHENRFSQNASVVQSVEDGVADIGRKIDFEQKTYIDL